MKVVVLGGAGAMGGVVGGRLAQPGVDVTLVDVARDAIGAGRYLDPTPLGDGRFLLDFNLAYNPYCAYNEQRPCPIMLPQNRLRVPIRAGECLFEHG